MIAVYTGAIEFERMPFANVAELLRPMEVPAPAVLAHSDELGIVAQEDLGDVTLQAHLGAASITEHAALYREAVALIHHLQRAAGSSRRAASCRTRSRSTSRSSHWSSTSSRAFSRAYRGIVLSPSEKAALAEEWAAMAEELSAEPRVLCHRDYHSRNLMLHQAGLHMVDFQDARLGPDTYDLASLLRDSYVDITDLEVDELIAYFAARQALPTWPEFRRRFDLMAVQRNIKALGTFGFQAPARENPPISSTCRGRCAVSGRTWKGTGGSRGSAPSSERTSKSCANMGGRLCRARDRSLSPRTCITASG